MAKTFYTNNKEPVKCFNVGTILNKKPVKGDIGIEIEVEGRNLPKEAGHLYPVWEYHKDGSLRGYDNAEYVLRKPIAFKEVENALTHLWGLFSKHSSILDESNRTSVHIHLNCQKFHLNRLTSFIALYLTFEEILTEWCGEHRVGNLFCLRAKDAPATVSKIKRFIVSDGQSELSEGLHYAGLNTNALHKFGSIEVRTLRGVSNPQVILDWIALLERLYRLSADFTDPRDICYLFSSEGPLSFFESILGDKAGVVRGGIDYNDDRVRDSMYEGIRMAQDLCYCRDWSMFQGIDIKDDPFGRDPRKVAKSVAAQETQMVDVMQSYLSTLESMSQSVLVSAPSYPYPLHWEASPPEANTQWVETYPPISPPGSYQEDAF